MAAEKRILVTGATGAQGGSVARHLLASGSYRVRCLTRNIQSEKAQALQQAGAELAQGDLEDIESLHNVLKGCDGVFGVTSFWEHFAKEYAHGKNLIEAIAQSDVAHTVFSSLPPAKKLSGGELDVPHFDLKAQMEEELLERGLPVTFTHVAFYYENFLFFFPPQKQEDGSYAFGFPQGDTPLAAVAVEDLGGVVRPLFDHPEEFIGKTVGVVGDDLPPAQYAEIMTRLLGKTIVYNYIPREVFASFGFPGAEDLANMFDFNRRFIPNRAADLAECRRLYPSMQTFETWLTANKDRFRDILSL
jgi:uncharacterized protein YbjT (DUF2867 family)